MCKYVGFYIGDVRSPCVCQPPWLSRNYRTGISAVTLLSELLPPVHQQLQKQGGLLLDVSDFQLGKKKIICFSFCIVHIFQLCSVLYRVLFNQR